MYSSQQQFPGAREGERTAYTQHQSLDVPQPYQSHEGYSQGPSEQQYNVDPSSVPPPATGSADRQVTRTASSNLLHKPVVIPATMPAIGSPFLRAYPPSLESYQISRELFLKFLDDLNRVAVANPPLQVLGLAGDIVGFVPLATAQIVGTAVSLAAKITTGAVSKGRTELFMRDANRTIFAPRGLKCEIAKIDAVAKIAGIPVLNAEGKVEKNTSLLEPIENLDSVADLTGQQRRLQALEPYIARLDLTPLPNIETPNNPLSKLSAGASERQRKAGEKKMLKSRTEAHSDYQEEHEEIEREYAEDMGKLDGKIEKMQAKGEKESKIEKQMSKIEKEKAKIQENYDKEMGKIEKDRRKDDKEESGMRKILWLMVRNLDADSGEGENADVSG